MDGFEFMEEDRRRLDGHGRLILEKGRFQKEELLEEIHQLI